MAEGKSGIRICYKKIADVQSTGETKVLPSLPQLLDSQPLSLPWLFSVVSNPGSRPIDLTKAGTESQPTGVPGGTNMTLLSATEGTAGAEAA